MESNRGPMGRASIEAYAGIAIAIIAVVLPMTWYWKLILVMVLAALVTDLLFRSPATASLARSLRAAISLLAVVFLGFIAWNPILEQYRIDSIASHPDTGVHPLSALIIWIGQVNERWLDRAIGAAFALVAITSIFILVVIVRWVIRYIRRRNQPLTEKGFLDHKANAERAMLRLPGPINKLAKIMRSVKVSLARHTKRLQGASSTEGQLSVSKSVARSLDGYSRRMKRAGSRLNKLGTSVSDGLEGWSEWAERTGANKQVEPGFTAALKDLVVNLKTSNEMLQSYVDSVNGVRGISGVLNLAIDRHTAVAQEILQTNLRIESACSITIQRLTA